MQCARSRIASLMMQLLVAVAVAVVAGCGGSEKPCMSMGSMSDLLGRAAIVRLDVYDAKAHCNGATVAEGAAPPTLSKVAAAGQPIELDVPSGTCVDGCVPAAPNCKTGDQCCSMLCIDVGSDIFNCGACGRACSSAHVTTPGCNSKVCAPQCAAGWNDCNHPLSGADDGCET